MLLWVASAVAHPIVDEVRSRVGELEASRELARDDGTRACVDGHLDAAKALLSAAEASASTDRTATGARKASAERALDVARDRAAREVLDSGACFVVVPRGVQQVLIVTEAPSSASEPEDPADDVAPLTR